MIFENFLLNPLGGAQPPEILRRADDAEEGMHLGPGVAPGEPTAHALSLHQDAAASQKSSKTLETNIRQKCGNKGVA